MAHASVGDRGANALMHALACNALVKTLSVKDNKLTSQGFMYVLNGMLRRVDPYGNSNALRASSPPASEVRGSLIKLCSLLAQGGRFLPPGG
jgi:hypothetical protein